MSTKAETNQAEDDKKKLFEGTKFRYENLLGKGAQGIVCDCLNTTTNEHVAIKVAEAYNISTEIKVFERLKDLQVEHPNLIEMLDNFNGQDSKRFVVYPLYGPSLSDALYQHDIQFTTQEVRKIGYQLISATLALHENRLLHSDIKTENVLLKGQLKTNDFNNVVSYEPEIVLCDFGMVHEDNDFRNYKISTLEYRAPDVAIGTNIGYKNDVWSIGCVLFEVFAGEKLFPVQNENDLYKIMDKTLGPFSLVQASRINGYLSQRGPKVNFRAGADIDTRRIDSYFDEDDLDQKHLKDLIIKMLEIKSDERISLSDALNSPFLTGFEKTLLDFGKMSIGD